MKRLTKALIAGTACMILLPSLSFAQAQSNTVQGSQILNGQVDFQASNSKLNTTLLNVNGDATAQSVAGGNAVDITTMNDTHVNNQQYVGTTNISSDINAKVKNIGGSATLQSQSICNSASVSTDPNVTDVYSNQECDAIDPSSSLSAKAMNIAGDATLASTAIGNTFEEDTNALSAPVQNYQINHSSINSTVNANVQNVLGSATVSSAAIGNTAQIVHY